MTDGTNEACPGCGAWLMSVATVGHPYFGASPACWARYGVVLAREYASTELMKVHRLTVDAYAAQHPGKPERRSTQSVWVHLAGLHLTIERGLAHHFATRVIGEMAARGAELTWLEPPRSPGPITVVDVERTADATSHVAAVQRWARSVWAAWSPHHEVVARAAELAAARL